jgi:hypothetical protein
MHKGDKQWSSREMNKWVAKQGPPVAGYTGHKPRRRVDNWVGNGWTRDANRIAWELDALSSAPFSRDQRRASI